MMREQGDVVLCGLERQAATQERETLQCAEQLHNCCDFMLGAAPLHTDDLAISRLRKEQDALRQQLATLEAQLNSLSASQPTPLAPEPQPSTATTQAHRHTQHLTQEVATAETDALRFLANNFSGEDGGQALQLDAVLSGDEAILRALDAGDTDRVNALLAALEEREHAAHDHDTISEEGDKESGEGNHSEGNGAGAQHASRVAAPAASIGAMEDIEAEAMANDDVRAGPAAQHHDVDHGLAMERAAEDTALGELMALVAQNPSALHSLPPGLQTILLDEVEDQRKSAGGMAAHSANGAGEHGSTGEGDGVHGETVHGRGDLGSRHGEGMNHFPVDGDSGGSAGEAAERAQRSEFMYRRSSFAERLAEYRAEQLSRASAEVPPTSAWRVEVEGRDAGTRTGGRGYQVEEGQRGEDEGEGEEGRGGGDSQQQHLLSRKKMPPASLFEAVEGRDHAAMEAFIKQGWDVNEQNQYGETPLHVAVTGDDIQAVAILLAANACAELQLNLCGWTPLHKAAARGNLPIVKTLVAFGADISHTKSDGLDAAAIAERNNHPHVKQYLEHWRHQTATPPLPVMAPLRLRCAVCIRRRFLQLQQMQVDELDVPDALKLFVNGGVPFQRVRRLPQQQPDKPSTPSPPAADSHVARHGSNTASAASADHTSHRAADKAGSPSSIEPSGGMSRIGTALVAVGAICIGGLVVMRWLGHS